MKHKWTLFTFSRGDFKTVEKYLNEQAEKGWELERAGVAARWKRTERTDLTYCVDLANPKQDRNEKREYVEFCGEGGWELTALCNQMYIFKSRPGTDAIPVQTDWEIERKQYNRYYIRNTILSVVVLAVYLGFVFLLGGDVLGSFRSLGNQWMTNWLGAALYAVLPFWGLWAVWKLVDFVRAVVKGRTGTVGTSPRWVMWVNCIVAMVAGVGAVLFYAGLALQFLFGAKLFSYITVFLFMWSSVLLWKAFEMEGEVFRGERRRYVVLGSGMLLVFALLIAGRVLLPSGSWSTSAFSMDQEKGVAVYEQTHELPLVHSEDVGIPFEPEEGETVYISHEVEPVGISWELTYVYSSKKTNFRHLDMGTKITECFTERAARLLIGLLTDGEETNRYGSVWEVKGLTPVEIGWTDEAWYGNIASKEGPGISILVLRIGKQVTRMIYPTELLGEETLAAIRAELSR